MQEEVKLTHQELRLWREHRSTGKILDRLREKADDHSTELCNGSRCHIDPYKPGGVIWTVGYLAGIAEIFNVEADEEEGNE